MNKNQVIEFLSSGFYYSLDRKLEPEKYFSSKIKYNIEDNDHFVIIKNLKTLNTITLVKFDVDVHALFRVKIKTSPVLSETLS